MNPDEPQLEKDVLESAKSQQNLSSGQQTPFTEKDFIANKPFLQTFPFWLWLFLAATLVLLILGIQNWYGQNVNAQDKKEPFMEVTNREFSVFLWQFPSFIRSNVSKKTGYIPGFYFDRENFDPTKSEEFVSAPPDLIFLYHTWKRLLAPYLSQRPISSEEFEYFLDQLTEWQPKNWQHAPIGYQKLIESKDYFNVLNLNTLSENQLPTIVRQAFYGWKNYFREGELINALNPTEEQIQLFLTTYPTYTRSFWRNIDEVAGQKVAGLDYLLFTLKPSNQPQDTIPADQLTPFLKVALYNDLNLNS